MKKVMTTDIFIDKMKKVHGDKYDYSLVQYSGLKNKVTIICKTHGQFTQTPNNHLYKKHGCPICGGSKKLTKDGFIINANIKHNHRYDYTLVNYKNFYTKVNIICKSHGLFGQTPANHINGHGCPTCVGLKKLTREEFINRSNEIHNHKYDYSMVIYNGMNKKIKILCPLHGVFEQTPNNHINQINGCPTCNTSKGELLIESYLQKNNIPYIKGYKFDDCKNIKKLIFDFYLPKHNTCIEYDGKQHQQPIEFFGGDIEFQLIKKRDNIKNIYCENNSIKLIRIPYNNKELSELIELKQV